MRRADSKRVHNPAARFGGAAGAGRPLPLSWLPPPSGGPERLRRAVRRARVAATLGSHLAPHLIDVTRPASGVVVLWFSGSGWEQQLRSLIEPLRVAVGRALGSEPERLEVRSAPAAPARATSAPVATRPPAGTARERLAAAAQRIRERVPAT